MQLIANGKRCRVFKKPRHDDYASDQIVLKTRNSTMLRVGTSDLTYIIDHVYDNGSLINQLRPGLLERINIRRVIPYR